MEIKLHTLRFGFRKLLYRMVAIISIASPVHAQISFASAEEVINSKPRMHLSDFIDINLEKIKVDQLLDAIEEKTDFKFVYDKSVLEYKEDFTLDEERISLYDLLEKISRKSDLRFKQVNNNINVRLFEKINEEDLSKEMDITITGTVIDQNGEPIPGVTVSVTETGIGTATDLGGNYSLTVPEGSILVFSFIGFESQKIIVGDKSVIDVTLTEDMSSLDEVVVVGYGTQKKADIIGAVSRVSSDQLEGRNVSQLSQSLTGQMPGVTIIQRSGRPGSGGGEISIRGVGSFGADPAALVLIDGIPGNLNDINPNDVGSISVLKDASSAAIYGARAANGVILVTTKTGSEGRIQISYNGYGGVQKATELPQLVNSWEYAELYNEATGNEVYTPEDIQKFREGTDPDNFPNTDFIGRVFSRNPVQTSHNLQLTGGNSENRYMVSMGYLNQQGLLDRNNYSRYNLRLNLNNKIGEKLTLVTRLSGVNETINEPAPPGGIEHTGMADIINLAVRIPSVYVGKLSNGDWGTGHAQMGTPLSYLGSESFYTDKPFSLNANMQLDWQMFPDFKLSLIGGHKRELGYQKRFLTSQRLNDNIFLGPTNVNQINNSNYYGTVQGLAEYDKNIEEHHIGALIGYSFESSRFETLSGYRERLPGNDLSEIDVGSPEGQQVNGTANEWALQSYFARFRYDYASKYMLESTMRYDGSSRFPSQKKYGFFPSVALGWRISEEEIFNSVNFIDDLKLKASYGELGNQNIGNYPYQTVLVSGYGYPFGGSLGTGVAATTLADPLLHWETTRSFDTGADIVLLDGGLEIGINYFNKKTYDILYQPTSSVSQVLGKTLSETNTGSLRNHGWEFTALYRKSFKDFNFTLSPNFSIINNKVLNLGVGNISQPNGMVGNGSSLFIGYPMQIYYGYVADGLYIDEDDVSSWADVSSVNPRPQPGDIRYKDISGPDGLPDGKVDATYDRTVLGSRIPKYTFGFSIGANYRGFDFNALIQGVAEVKGMLGGYAGYAFYNTASIQEWMMETRWTPEKPNRDAAYPRLELISNQGTPNTVESSFWLPDASYVRLKNIQVGYSLPKKLVNGWKIQNIRLYVSAENLYTWNKYRKGWDPEINTSGSFYPIFTNYTFGLNVKF